MDWKEKIEKFGAWYFVDKSGDILTGMHNALRFVVPFWLFIALFIWGAVEIWETYE